MSARDACLLGHDDPHTAAPAIAPCRRHGDGLGRFALSWAEQIPAISSASHWPVAGVMGWIRPAHTCFLAPALVLAPQPAAPAAELKRPSSTEESAPPGLVANFRWPAQWSSRAVSLRPDPIPIRSDPVHAYRALYSLVRSRPNYRCSGRCQSLVVHLIDCAQESVNIGAGNCRTGTERRKLHPQVRNAFVSTAGMARSAVWQIDFVLSCLACLSMSYVNHGL